MPASAAEPAGPDGGPEALSDRRWYAPGDWNAFFGLALDNLGVDRDLGVGSLHMRFWGATLARNLPAVLEIYADILRRPHLPAGSARRRRRSGSSR